MFNPVSKNGVKSTLEWFKKKHWTVLPVMSSDLNLFQNLW